MLIKNWRRILRRAWSIRLAILAAMLSGLETVLPLLSDAMPRGLFAVLACTVSVGAAVARIVSQQGIES